MTLITWTNEEFGTKVSAHDIEHQKLFTLLNRLHESIPSEGRAAVNDHLDALISYVAEHFSSEEENMAKIGYADLAKHKEEHDKLVQVCVDLQQRCRAGQADLTRETTEFLREWLVTHIPSIDRAYGPVMNSNGIA